MIVSALPSPVTVTRSVGPSKKLKAMVLRSTLVSVPMTTAKVSVTEVSEVPRTVPVLAKPAPISLAPIWTVPDPLVPGLEN